MLPGVYLKRTRENRLLPKPTADEKAAVAAAETARGGGSGSRVVAKLRAREQIHETLLETNSETFRLTNDGRFPVKILLAFEKQQQVSARYAIRLLRIYGFHPSFGQSTQSVQHESEVCTDRHRSRTFVISARTSSCNLPERLQC